MSNGCEDQIGSHARKHVARTVTGMRWAQRTSFLSVLVKAGFALADVNG